MSRLLKFAAAGMLFLWIFMISAPLVFGAADCDCKACHANQSCPMKHSQSQKMPCHQQSAPRGYRLQKHICHEEVVPVIFSYVGILPETGSATIDSISMMPLLRIGKVDDGTRYPDIPPPKQLSL